MNGANEITVLLLRALRLHKIRTREMTGELWWVIKCICQYSYSHDAYSTGH
jgi:hypothetical protein